MAGVADKIPPPLSLTTLPANLSLDCVLVCYCVCSDGCGGSVFTLVTRGDPRHTIMIVLILS